jgi:hypothetical protein
MSTPSLIWTVEGYYEFSPGEPECIFAWGFTDLTAARQTKRLLQARHNQATWSISEISVNRFSELDIEIDAVAETLESLTNDNKPQDTIP